MCCVYTLLSLFSQHSLLLHVYIIIITMIMIIIIIIYFSEGDLQVSCCDSHWATRNPQEIFQAPGHGANTSWKEADTGGHLVCQPEANGLPENYLQPY